MKQKIPYADALASAVALKVALASACERVLIAGSIRRCKREIGDLELVLIPRTTPILDMFGEPTGEAESALDQRISELGLVPIKGGDKYKQLRWQDVQADLFICSAETWAMNATIRTGSADFTHWLVTPRRAGGAMPAGFRAKDARLWNGDQALPLVDEEDVFEAIGLPWVEPEERIEGRWAR